MAEKLYKFHWDFGRMGDVEGLFIEEESAIQSAIGDDVYFGEILGKHSEVFGTLKAEDFVALNVSDQTLTELKNNVGAHISGYNPLDYLHEEEE